MTMTHDDQFVRYRINVGLTAKGLAQPDVTKEKFVKTWDKSAEKNIDTESANIVITTNDEVVMALNDIKTKLNIAGFQVVGQSDEEYKAVRERLNNAS
jgi:3-isopropylmalate dehydratase small subunit